MIVYGLTGGIASGKSTVAALLVQAGYEVVDCDDIVRRLYDKGKPIYNAVLDAFGTQILNSDGEIDRKLLGAQIFKNAEDRIRLNSVTHPIIQSEVERQLVNCQLRGDNLVFVDVPLLYESNLSDLYQGIVVVYCAPSLQRKRLMERNGYSASEAALRIKSQIPMEEKRVLADYVIENQGSFEDLKIKVYELLDILDKI